MGEPEVERIVVPHLCRYMCHGRRQCDLVNGLPELIGHNNVRPEKANRCRSTHPRPTKNQRIADTTEGQSQIITLAESKIVRRCATRPAACRKPAFLMRRNSLFVQP